MKKIYLVDVSSMFFRAYYAIRPLSSPSGVPVNAVYGFLSMITKLFKEEKPDYFVFAYDRKEPSFRKDMYAEYKANRSEMPDDLATQIPYIKKLADCMGIPGVEVDRYEADDIIGTLVNLGLKHQLQVVIVSGDKDFGQLIQKDVVMYDTMKDVKYDEAGVLAKWGVRPDQFIDYLALVGDSSDNIPGVAGIGPKGAQKLLEQYKTIEDIYVDTRKVEPKGIREKLERSKENALLSKKLVTIAMDVPVSDNFEDYKLKPFKTEELRQLLQDLNFKTFEKNLLGEGTSQNSLHENMHGTEENPIIHPPKPVYVPMPTHQIPEELKIATLPSEAMAEIEAYMSIKEVVVTVSELDKILKHNDSLWGFCDERGIFVARDKELWAIPTGAETLGAMTDLKNVRWSGFDLKKFFHQIKAHVPVVDWDSALGAYVVRAGDSSEFEDMYKKFTGGVFPEFMTPAQLYKAHMELKLVLIDRLGLFDGEKIVRELELPLVPILLKMEQKGIRIDTELLSIQSAELTDEIAELEKEVHSLAGESFNVGSPKQLGVILFDKLKLPPGKKTKTGFSTDTDVLQGLEHPVAKKVLQWRELSKLKSTYVDALPALISTEDGRLHTRFNQALTTTGRLSSTQPNLQNIPIRTPRGERVRQAFIADPGQKLLSVDYSQIELRILAHISEDPGLQRAFRDDLDIHTATAAEIFNVDLKAVTGEQRRNAKAVNFGIAYGQGAFGLAENLGIPRKDAQEIIGRYFEKFSGVREYIDSTIKQAHAKGYVETLFGRRRYLEELSSKNQAMKKFGERAAINAPIQGTASDLVKKAMIDIGQQIKVDMLLQVHDELIFEGTEEHLHSVTPEIVRLMENAMSLKVPLKVNYAIGNNWDEAH
ncbi:MAG: DNA polymerase I [Bdellovibrionaceae bacterium]|nr:DNA polymerase I [Pseudobdellovibrionaceae bacterium]